VFGGLYQLDFFSYLMANQFSQNYNPKKVEGKWYASWSQNECFAGRVDLTKEPFSIVIPPPNVTGVLTMGHVLNNTLQDVLIRRARQEGKSAMWLPGTDHAGIATQTRVERELRTTEKKTRHDLGREAFLEKVWDWRNTHGDIIIEQLKRLGSSCDWDRTVFTMDEDYSKKVIKAFVELYKSGNIYRGKRMVNWCPVSLTALSDEEVIMKPQKGILYKMRYELVDFPGEYLEISTTRPETLMGDSGIAVHPDDKRYKHLIGKHAWRPFPRKEIPIVTDREIDMEFGTGVLKVTPAHDKVDFEIGRKNDLEVIDVLNPDGTLNELAGEEFVGMDRFKARKVAAEKLDELGLLVAEEPYENSVGFSERADVPIEPRMSEQWFLKYPNVEEAKAAVKDGHIRFHPERWAKVYQNWLGNIQDWCISRQLWWGHRIPVWYRKGEDRSDSKNWYIDETPPSDPENWEQDEDVLDTWASSWLWPFATMGWPEKEEEEKQGLEYFYPTSTLVTGPDIIFFWVARMIMAGLRFMHPGESIEKRIPFKDVYFTGIIRDPKGRKMSKSLGNSPDPLDLIDTYGADGLRFGIISIAPQGQDIRFQEDRIESGRNFCTKLWNACRFRQISGEMQDNSSLEAIINRLDVSNFDNDDHAILLRLFEIEASIAEDFKNYEFNRAVQNIYGFFWNDFCDWYVEVSKSKLKDEATKENCLAIQDFVLRQVLLLLHPFTPFITEELWHTMGYGKEGEFIQNESFAISGIREKMTLDSAAANEISLLKTFAASARALKAEYNLASRRDVKLFLSASETQWTIVEQGMAKLCRMAGAAEILSQDDVESAPAVVTPLGTLYLDLASSVDVWAERERLGKEFEKLSKAIVSGENRLKNEGFTSRAPAEVIEGAKKQLADNQAKQKELERLLEALRS
jgi:valyl-tRNA synthetase